MSIEQQLQQHFHRRAEKLACPVEIDDQVQKKVQSLIYTNDAQKTKMTSCRLPIFSMIAIVILLLSGFAFASTQLLFKANKDNHSYEFYADPTLTLQHITGKEIRESLNYVKSQLAIDETAVVYLSDFAKEKHPLIKKNPLISVSNPYIETNFTHWNNTLDQALSEYNLPADLLDEYAFVGGKFGYPLFPNSITPSEDQLINSLRKEAKETGTKLVWQKITPSASPTTAYTSIYKNNDGDEVYVTMELFPEGPIRVESFANEAMAYEQLSINDKEAFYIHSQNFFSETDQYQDLFWMESVNRQTVVYRIGTTSIHLSREDLVSIANHMK